MSETPELRQRPDRRQQARGGRRTGDADDLAPLVLLVGDDPAVVPLAEAVLAKLRFAVTTLGTVDHALNVVPTLRPDIIVAASDDAPRLRLEIPVHLPVVCLTDGMREDPESLITAIREALARPAS
jgi:hypothetical protein